MGVETAIIAASIAATAFSAYSTVQSGKQASLNAEAQSDQAQIDADGAASAAVVQADRIRRLARTQAGSANAALAASGVEVGAGTAININEEIIGNAEEDAALTIFNGENQKKRGYVDASNIAAGGRQAQSSANSQAAGTVLAGAAQTGMAWKASATRNGTTAKVGGAD
ncbi:MULTISPECIES: hypothetical protein [Pseudomonas syringae group genomosp. 2]|uniref:Phage protein n=2 Tax=Pseudomonas savastanoi TaxID=29438 RepID=A0A267KCK5_PSESS|nr:hypothetical protein [Pseudomonas savastanoi]ARD11407.1 hypothetical protein PSA3335_10215 [Pseudomonas savastanoi pv. savastanoi NCPPB 3335]MBA4702963.1 hypothetical protein [Pseudomonas savastanoi pv. savastanoi]PAB32831.1 hypothetical protein CC205_13635 [Pseudomonas savastanoi pv. nerii]RMN71285.1 putative phage protein [Pseudomonas savastanoi pv. savastanoi]RMT72332.1 putative phage protein [Pseudomonas savastanoi pv. nerii]